MKSKIVSRTSFVLLQTLLINGSLQGNPQSPPKTASAPSSQGSIPETMPKTSENLMFFKIEEALKPFMEAATQNDEALAKRTQTRSDARETQRKGEEAKKIIKQVMNPLKRAGTTAGFIATASGDYHTKMAAAVFRLSVTALQGLGEGVAGIVIGVGRYQERSQEILTTTEVLIEDLQKSVEKVKVLRQKQGELLDIGRAPQPSQSSSRLKRLGREVYNAPKKIDNKVREATDLFTNSKTERGERLKEIQEEIRKEMENFNEVIRLLQIKLLQDATKEIDKKINVENTISKLNYDLHFYQTSKNILSPKEKEKINEIDKQIQKIQKDISYYINFQKNPDKTSEQLEEEKSDLIEKAKELKDLTRMGDSIYLQGKGIDPNESQLNRATVVALYKKIEAIDERLKKIEGQTSPASGTKPAPPPRRMEAKPGPAKQPPFQGIPQPANPPKRTTPAPRNG